MKSIPQNLIAVILSGGQSSRMGDDKGLLKHDGIAWVETLKQKLTQLGLPVYVSINLQQKKLYETVLPAQILILDNQSLLHINGPLKGMLSAHQAFPHKDLLFLPCDMPLLDVEAFEWWINTFQQLKEENSVVVSSTERQLQPLCGIYSHSALNKLDEYYQNGDLQNQSMHAVIENILQAKIMEVPGELLPLFKNYNTPQDLDENEH